MKYIKSSENGPCPNQRHVDPQPLPPPLKVAHFKVLDQKDAHCFETYEKTIFWFYSLRNGLFCSQILRKFGERFLRTWFRNANQCYPVTSWLWEFNPKAFVAWGRSSPNTRNFWNFFSYIFLLLQNMMTFFLAILFLFY